MLGAIAEGVTEVSGFLEGEDSLATLRAFRALGVEIQGPQGGRVRIAMFCYIISIATALMP